MAIKHVIMRLAKCEVCVEENIDSPREIPFCSLFYQQMIQSKLIPSSRARASPQAAARRSTSVRVEAFFNFNKSKAAVEEPKQVDEPKKKRCAGKRAVALSILSLKFLPSSLVGSLNQPSMPSTSRLQEARKTPSCFMKPNTDNEERMGR